MDTPFYHDNMSGAFTPHHQYPHRFHGDYQRYPSNSKAPTTPKKATMSSYFSGLGAGPGAGVKSNSLGLPGHASGVGQSLAAAASSSDADLLLVQATNHTPNPGGHLLYRAQATNEQEGFADGFVKALADLHKQNQLIGGGVGGGGSNVPGTGGCVPGMGSGSGVPGTGGADVPIYTNLSSYSAQNQMGYHQVGYQGPAGGPGRDGPLQVVPHALPLHNSSSSPTLSPVDLETQDRIKSERKKLRNRIAASKCRKRKLERIARLEDKVSLLKGFNGDLASTAAILKQDVEHLREKVRSHMTRGCQIIITGGGGRRGGEIVEKEEGNPSWGKKSKY